MSRGIRAAQTVRHASNRLVGPGVLRHHASFAEHPAFRPGGRGRRRLCKVDQVLVKFPKVRVYQDWRELLKKERDHIDSVSVSTPDHMHCMVAVEALRRNKPVYVQKPLCNTLHEVRRLTDLARKRGLTTQMGIQVSSSKDAALRRSAGQDAASSGRSRKSTRSRTRAGATTSRWSIAWMRCHRRSTGISGSASRRRDRFKRGVYHPGEWRKRVGFGTGTLGDMGCHIYSPPYRALGLTSPIGVMAFAPRRARRAGQAREGQADLPGTRSHRGQHGGRLVVRRRGDAAGIDPRAGGRTRVPDQGSIVIGYSTGSSFSRTRAHQRSCCRPTRARTCPRSIWPSAITTRSSSRRCWRAARRRARPASITRGPPHRVGAHRQRRRAFPGETLAFDGKALHFTNKPGSESATDADLPEGVDDPAWRLVSGAPRFARRLAAARRAAS